jgi:hypothetical protein
MTADASGNSELVAAVRSAAAGDPRGWADLTGNFAAMIMGIARGCRLDETDVADVHQTTWLRLVETIGAIENPEWVGNWLATTTKAESLRVLQARTTQAPLGELSDDRTVGVLSPAPTSSIN